MYVGVNVLQMLAKVKAQDSNTDIFIGSWLLKVVDLKEPPARKVIISISNCINMPGNNSRSRCPTDNIGAIFKVQVCLGLFMLQPPQGGT